MTRRNKILATSLWAVALLAMAGMIACFAIIRGHELRASQIPPEVQPPLPSFDVANFSLTDQLGQKVSADSLKGHVWIASFIFTRCVQLCPMMSTELSTLQNKLTNPDIKIISFSVDPKFDTPSVLKAYGQRYHANNNRWLFLTGDPMMIGNVATSLKLGVALGPVPGQLTHSDKLVLIGPDGKSHGIYTGIDDNDINRLAIDAEKLATSHP